jgi:hypothetical protein
LGAGEPQPATSIPTTTVTRQNDKNGTVKFDGKTEKI